jgi:branched-chain amino acid transport system ATP-binding protein
MTASTRPLLRVTAIHVVYDGVIAAVHDVSLEVPEGGIVALLGANGAGKSTTLKAISGLVGAERGRIVSGTIEFDGVPIHRRHPSELAGLGLVQVLEGRRCFQQLTVEENLLTGAFARHLGRQARRRALERVWHHFPKLVALRRKPAGYASGGEQQMVAIGRALMAQPKLMLLDEPSMGLAPQMIDEIFRIVRDLHDQEGTSFLLAEQNATQALRFADHGVLLANGHVVAHDTAAALAAREDVKAFYLGTGDTGRRRFGVAAAATAGAVDTNARAAA